MKYYEGRENSYRKLEQSGLENWDNLCDQDWQFEKTALYRTLTTLIPKVKTRVAERPSALDIGCGTGTVSWTLANAGFDVAGIDVSPTAIKLAKNQALSKRLSAQFLVADLCEWSVEKQFDLIVDSHCLHCLVFDSDRRKALSNIHRMLAPSGTFLIESMATSQDMTFGDHFELNHDGVLWNKIANDPKTKGWVEKNGFWYFPNCRIYSAKTILEELTAAGFSVVVHSIVPPDNPGEPASLQAECRLDYPCDQIKVS